MSAVNKILNRQEPPLIYDFSALDVSGEPVWYFLAIPKSREKGFLLAISQPDTNIDIKRYGEILASGPGNQPPESVRKEILAKYAASDRDGQ